MTRRLPPAAAALALALALAASPALARQYSETPAAARVAADSVASGDTLVGPDGTEASATIDLAGVWQPVRHVQVAARPVFTRNYDGEWDADVYQLAVRMDHPGRIRWRWEGGFLPSPVGTMALETRADQNPVIVPATSYSASLPPFEVGTPQVQLASSSYPLAAQLNAFTDRLDGRVALLGSSPVRVRPLTGADKPPALAQIAAGGGVTPHIGLRLGGSFVHGAYATAGEVADPSRGNRMATILAVDADYSVGYTRVYAEWQRNAYQRATDDVHATALTATAMRTIGARWFAAARYQRQTTSDMLATPGSSPGYGDVPAEPTGKSYGDHTYYAGHARLAAAWADAGPGTALGVQAVLGYRLTPALTFRGGYVGYRSFGSDELEHHAAVSVVWATRWR